MLQATKTAKGLFNYPIAMPTLNCKICNSFKILIFAHPLPTSSLTDSLVCHSFSEMRRYKAVRIDVKRT